MSTSAQILAKTYTSKLTYLEHTRNKIERLYLEGSIVRRDIEQVYEALYISSITAFEALLEDLFFGLLMGRLSSTTSGMRCKVTVSSEIVAREIALAGDKYLDWLPYKRTEERARTFFASGIPFSLIDGNKRSLLQECLFIRNAIAHRSIYATEIYKKNVLGSRILPPRQRGPASFLRSQFRTSPSQCRYEYYIANLIQISRLICK